MAKLKPNEKRVYLSFQRNDDLRLFEFMEKRAYECRWDLGTFILASLQDAFRGQIDEAEVDAAAEEALRKVRERASAPPAPPVVIDAPIPEPSDVSPEDAYELALKQVQVLNEKSLREARTSVPVPPVLPETATSTTPATGKPQKQSRRKTGA